MNPPTSGGDVGAQATVFLSHSGRQKAFVEYLYDALKRAHCTAFFDKYSLERASYFPSDIKRALRGCKLGVVVLSDDFFSSNWPMIELEVLLSENIRVLPLFYQITPKELTSPENLLKWKNKWISYVNQRQIEQSRKVEQIEQWEEAVKRLGSTTGEIFIRSENEFVYIKRVVKVICKIIPSNVLYDLSYAQGHQRLTKEIEGYFDKVVDAAKDCGKACMLGLHGIGGLGKTTLCKSMVNFFTSQYLGKSCLIEFPTDCDKTKVVQECKAALKKLANLSEDVLEQSNSFDQVVQLMREHVAKLDVFIAVDNVVAKSEEDAGRLLGIGFNAASKVLVTSRSGEILKSLFFGNRKNSYIDLLPAPNREDAFLIFQKSVDRGDITSSPVRNVIDRGLERCMFNGKYHPLALKGLGGYMRSQFYGREVSKVDEGEWSHIFGGIGSTAMQSVENTIKLNYDGLEEHMKHMFLDIVFCIPCSLGNGVFGYRHKLDPALVTKFANYYVDVACWWLGTLYKFNEIQIKKVIYDLALAGVIQLEKDEDGRMAIRVHDLYTELAWKEVVASPRFLVAETEETVKEIECDKLERVLWENGEDGRFIEKLRLSNSQQIQYFHASNIQTRSRWVCSYLPLMPSLRFLELHSESCKKAMFAANNRCSRVLVQLLECVHILKGEGTINLNGLVQLERMSFQNLGFVRLEGLDSLLNLRRLFIWFCPSLKKLEGLGRLTQLELLCVCNCRALKKVAGLSGVTSLKWLRLRSNTSLKELEPPSPTPQCLLIYDCDGLRMPNMLQVRRMSSFAELNNRFYSSILHGIEHLRIEERVEDKKISVGKFTGLRLLEVRKCEALEEIEGLGELHKLRKVVLHDCERLEDRFGHVHALVQRRSSIVEISGCPSLETKVKMKENFQSLDTECYCYFCLRGITHSTGRLVYIHTWSILCMIGLIVCMLCTISYTLYMKHELEILPNTHCSLGRYGQYIIQGLCKVLVCFWL